MASSGNPVCFQVQELMSRVPQCNREWPCNHCQKRKVADKCCFNQISVQAGPEKTMRQAINRKRQLSLDESIDTADSTSWDEVECDFESLGYTASHLFGGLNPSSTRKTKPTPRTYNQHYMDTASCPQLKRALQLLPPRPYTDSLVQNFLNNVNFHYYILYPSSFLEEYRTWWSLRSENRPLGLQWTCLLLTVCACSTQYTDVELQRKLETDLGQSTQKLTEQYHNAARELHSVIPVRSNHLLNVQTLLHSCFWYKSEARFVECWHVLSAAIREAQELGIHQETVSGPMPEFDREMRRRVWCILDTWDWQISALLSRPMIIDRSDCDVGLPNLTLEGYSPSPLLHIKLQSELIGNLSKRFSNAKTVVQPTDVETYQTIVETWMRNFPPTYDITSPDKSNDASRPWIVSHRYHLHVIALSMLLEPFRAYLTKPLSKHSPMDELKIRSDGISYALRLMVSLHEFFDHVYPRDANFHYILFCIFDTAAVLCSALMHDQDGSIPNQNGIFRAIDKAVAMLKRLNTVAKTARTSYEVLVKVAQRIPRPAPVPKQRWAAKRQQQPPIPKDLALTPPIMSQAELSMASDPGSVESILSYTTPPSEALVYHLPLSQSTSPGLYDDGTYMYTPPIATAVEGSNSMIAQQMHGTDMSMSTGVYPMNYIDMTPPTDEFYDNVNFGPISEQELGDLALMWNYESLNLGFINPGGYT
ncbi:hypothetical protein E4U43_000515 [Claviceps pusilla]|uniref:Xylanolytic transcriptional activator regulatory domain-containing protein n=1 Tax=Claviceps pusilla TaxID=123648 RepID=A0A9P7NBF0_9HYPO|nr:hypothetical protein E4U43_000515 [Claviceps pusilla]